MESQTNLSRRSLIAFTSAGLLARRAVAAPVAPARITIPEPMAIELPPGVATLSPLQPPLRDLLSAATCPGRRVTFDLAHPVGAGPVRVTWAARGGEAHLSPPATQSAVLFVLPTGATPVGLSGDENATGGNNASRIARDSAGQVHMVWLDGGRPGVGIGVMYRRASTLPDGSIHWETPPIRIEEAGKQTWNGYVGLAISERTVHIAWQSGVTARYRRLSHRPGGWTFGPVRDLAARSEGRDVGPAIAARGRIVHIATPEGIDIVSEDGGDSWTQAPIPIPAGQRMKSVTVALDSLGNAHFAFTGTVHGPENPSSGRPSRGYWELRYVRRSVDGKWVDAQNALAGRPEWARANNDDDVLADWPCLAIDDRDAIHLGWHGSARSRMYGHDQSYYMYRPTIGPGAWQDHWTRPVALMPTGSAPGVRFSFAPSLALDGTIAVPVTFYDIYDGTRWAGFDSAARVIRGGQLVGAPIPVAHWVSDSVAARRPEAALGARFSVAAPRIYHAPDGRLWLDVLETLMPMGVPGAPDLIVYQRVDVTRAVRAA